MNVDKIPDGSAESELVLNARMDQLQELLESVSGRDMSKTINEHLGDFIQEEIQAISHCLMVGITSYKEDQG